MPNLNGGQNLWPFHLSPDAANALAGTILYARSYTLPGNTLQPHTYYTVIDVKVTTYDLYVCTYNGTTYSNHVEDTDIPIASLQSDLKGVYIQSMWMQVTGESIAAILAALNFP